MTDTPHREPHKTTEAIVCLTCRAVLFHGTWHQLAEEKPVGHRIPVEAPEPAHEAWIKFLLTHPDAGGKHDHDLFIGGWVAREGAARWISVEERLPELADEYLVVERGDRHSSTADWIGGIWKTARSFGQDCEERELYNVSHWQYLPETPEAPAAELGKDK